LGVSLHLITMATIPWVELDLNRSEIKADKTFEIAIENHENKRTGLSLSSPLIGTFGSHWHLDH